MASVSFKSSDPFSIEHRARLRRFNNVLKTQHELALNKSLLSVCVARNMNQRTSTISEISIFIQRSRCDFPAALTSSVFNRERKYNYEENGVPIQW